MRTVLIDSFLQLKEVAHGLSFLHGLSPSIIHCDIKPGSIVVKDDLRAAICGFGSAVYGPNTDGEPTRIVETFGTPGYAPPEAKRNDQWFTPAIDVYSFGCLIIWVRSHVLICSSVLLLISAPDPYRKACREIQSSER